MKAKQAKQYIFFKWTTTNQSKTIAQLAAHVTTTALLKKCSPVIGTDAYHKPEEEYRLHIDIMPGTAFKEWLENDRETEFIVLHSIKEMEILQNIFEEIGIIIYNAEMNHVRMFGTEPIFEDDYKRAMIIFEQNIGLPIDKG